VGDIHVFIHPSIAVVVAEVAHRIVHRDRQAAILAAVRGIPVEIEELDIAALDPTLPALAAPECMRRCAPPAAHPAVFEIARGIDALIDATIAVVIESVTQLAR
jgi:hypothetical protein